MSKATRCAKEGLEVGLLAGIVFAGVQALVAMAMGVSPWTPVRMAASLVLGPSALDASVSEVLRVGPVVHLGLSAAFGLLYGIISSLSSEDVQQNPWVQAITGLIFGAALYVIDLQLIARVAYPWLLDAPQPAQLAMHALGFGLPLGLLYAAVEWRVHTVPRYRPVYAAR